MTQQHLPGLEPAPPRYREGDAVVAAVDLYNDGSHPDAAEDQLLAVPGCTGEIVQVGRQQDGGLPVYMVDFGHAVIGCFEEELLALSPLSPERSGQERSRPT